MTKSAIEPAKQSLVEYEMPFEADRLAQVMSDNFGDEQIKVTNLKRLVNPSGKSTKWEIPLVTGETETTGEIEGIIIFHKLSRARWDGDYKGGGDAPLCSSKNGFDGEGDPGGKCKKCPHEQFTEDSKGEKIKPECRIVKQVFIRPPGKILPMILNVTAVNLPHINSYLYNLFDEGLSFNAVVTKVSLSQDKSKSGFDYAKTNFAATAFLSPEQALEMAEYTKLIKPMLLEIELTGDEEPW